MQGVKTKFLTKDDIGSGKMKASKVLPLAEEGLNPDVMKKVKDPKLKEDLLKLEDDSVSSLPDSLSWAQLTVQLGGDTENHSFQVRRALPTTRTDPRGGYVRQPGPFARLPQVPSLFG